MSRDNKEDILLGSKAINLYSNARVVIIGGGRAGYIKLKSFVKSGFSVDVLSHSFLSELEEFSLENPKVKLIESDYCREVLDDYELVIIGTDNQDLNREIARECRLKKKVFIYLPDSKCGNIAVPVEIETENVKVALGTRSGSPKTALFLGEKIKKVVEEYDGFVGYVCSVREKIEDSEVKRKIMEFMNTDEFYESYREGKADTVLETIYGGDFFEGGSGD